MPIYIRHACRNVETERRLTIQENPSTSPYINACNTAAINGSPYKKDIICKNDHLYCTAIYFITIHNAGYSLLYPFIFIIDLDATSEESIVEFSLKTFLALVPLSYHLLAHRVSLGLVALTVLV